MLKRCQVLNSQKMLPRLRYPFCFVLKFWNLEFLHQHFRRKCHLQLSRFADKISARVPLAVVNGKKKQARQQVWNCMACKLLLFLLFLFLLLLSPPSPSLHAPLLLSFSFSFADPNINLSDSLGQSLIFWGWVVGVSKPIRLFSLNVQTAKRENPIGRRVGT